MYYGERFNTFKNPKGACKRNLGGSIVFLQSSFKILFTGAGSVDAKLTRPLSIVLEDAPSKTQIRAYFYNLVCIYFLIILS